MFGHAKTSPPPSPTSDGSALSANSYSNGSHSSNLQRQDSRLSATAKRQKYFRRLVKFRQMDFEYAFWQMVYLFMSPQKVYRNFQYRKHTKDQWARDDPAFLVLLSIWLCVSTIGLSVVLGIPFVGFIKFLFWVIFIDCIGVGLMIATLFWLIANRYMIQAPPRGQDVEWAYAFDVHLNAFFPLLMILHFIQLPLLNYFIMRDWYISCVFGNTIWLIAIGYYIYITFLGYSALPFLKNTRILLYPYTVVVVVFVLSLVFHWNFTSWMCHFYTYRVA